MRRDAKRLLGGRQLSVGVHCDYRIYGLRRRVQEAAVLVRSCQRRAIVSVPGRKPRCLASVLGEDQRPVGEFELNRDYAVAE